MPLQREPPEEEFKPQTEERPELVPPRRRPPTALGAGDAGAPPPPPRPPRGSPGSQPPDPVRRLTARFLAAINRALDVADLAAAVIARTMGRPPGPTPRKHS